MWPREREREREVGGGGGWRHTERQRERYGDIQRDRERDMETYRETEREIWRHTERQRDMETGAVGQTDRDTGKQLHTDMVDIFCHFIENWTTALTTINTTDRTSLSSTDSFGKPLHAIIPLQLKVPGHKNSEAFQKKQIIQQKVESIKNCWD